MTGAGAATSAELISLEDEVYDSSTRRAGYYYPESTSGEFYVARTET